MRLFFTMILSMLASCVGCAHSSFLPAIQPPAATNSPLGVTVALVNDNNAAYCAGTWVSEHTMITASHCVIDDDTDDVLKTVHVRDHEGNIFEANVAKVSKRQDLALLQTKRNHAYAEVASSWSIGEELTIIGHPAGTEWVWMRGWISVAVKHESPKADGEYMSMLQVQAPVWYGNSGGAAFDSQGRLVGVASMRSVKIPDLGLFVAPSEIALFLALP